MVANRPLDCVAIEKVERNGSGALIRKDAQAIRRSANSRHAMTLANHQGHCPPADHTCCTENDDAHMY